MSDRNPDTLARRRPKRALVSVAAIALVASGALGATALVSHRPAAAVDAANVAALRAQPQPRDQPPATFADVVDKVKPAVVAVEVKVETASSDEEGLSSNELERLPPQLRELFRRFGESGAPQAPHVYRQALGSGFFVSADGYVVTNNHVVEHATAVQITTDDGRKLDAKVVGTDPKTDLALLKISESGSYPYVRLATTAPRVGDWVIAVGNPFGLGGTVTTGIVSARGRDIGASQYDDFLQIDAPINKGNSGGPTFNLDGEVVGVNTAIYSPSGGSVGLAFAIPSETVQSVVAQLEQDGKVTRGYLGVQVQPLTKDLADSLGLSSENGAVVAGVPEDTPATKAGLKAGDVITAVNGEAIASARALSRKIAAVKPGSRVELTYWRRGKEQSAEVELGALPNNDLARSESREDQSPQLGLELAPAHSVPGVGNKGVAIVGVDPLGPAAAKGIRSGDVILEVNGQVVSTPADVQASLHAALIQSKKGVLLRVKSRAGTHFVAVAVPKAG
jgi:serine protease Do